MTETTTKLVIILGMHRSGTSAVTRGLQVMGVELGNNFIPPQEDNITGFWEDADVNALNIELLQCLNSDWHFLTPVTSADIQLLRERGYVQKGVDLLQGKISGSSIFGIKDPRIAKLLPFWKEVISTARLKVSYVLVIRHPLSVGQSLEKRHGFELEKSSLLWLEHVISSLAGTAGENCVLIDYDRLVQKPNAELEKIADRLDLQIIPAEFEKFQTDFLNQGLRHTVYQIQDLMQESKITMLVQEVYSSLLQIAAGEKSLESLSTREQISKWEIEFFRLIPVLAFIDKLDAKIKTLDREAGEREAQLQTMASELNEIKESKAWQLVLRLRRMRIWLIPPDGWLEKLFKRTFPFR